MVAGESQMICLVETGNYQSILSQMNLLNLFGVQSNIGSGWDMSTETGFFDFRF